ncbi:MAG: PAS domain-containing protein [Chlorobiales bacterium]|nr:PAS domain-containing protein [Chlorobiales bacterium]
MMTKTDALSHEEQLPATSLKNGLTHIVGIGASAGGLDPLERFFDSMPHETNMAFVVVQHLSPDFKSLMDELLARHTRMPIHRVIDGIEVEPGNIYLIPPKKDMIIEHGCLRLTDKDSAQPLSLPIDTFFRSLARDAGERAIAIILSGTGSDGSRSLIDLHQAMGLVIVQSPESSAFDGMPRSAIETGLVDIITEPELMPEVIKDHVMQSLKGADISRMLKYEIGPTGKFAEVFRLLKDNYKIDFSFYKPTTVDRRIERRMNMLHFDSIGAYSRRLTEDNEELNSLYHDLLIGVTKFFRDPEAYEKLGEKVIPEIIRRAQAQRDDEIRVWVCGCATGEEAYSLAILFNEVAEKLKSRIKVKIFATDVHRTSLDFASDGIYEEAGLENLSPELKEKYFHRENGKYKTGAHVRQMIVFSEQNVLTDPPFIKIDLVSCRNLLIYFQVVAQNKAQAMFHFALKHKGYLFLGASENLGAMEEEFDTIERSWKIYQKKRDVRLPSEMRLTLGMPGSRMGGVHTSPPLQNIPGDMKLLRAYDALLDRFMPPGLLVSDARQLLHAFGDAGRFFKVITGRLSSDVLNLVDGDLRLAMTSAFQRSIKDNVCVKYSAIEVHTLVGKERIDLEIEPLQVRGGTQTYYLVLFRPSKQTIEFPPQPEENGARDSFDISEVSMQRITYLEQELLYTKEHLQTTVEELETSNEELQATNEELLASNEELQSTNEELHSVNEELYTVNAEYERKNKELEQLADDMENLLRSTEIGTVFVDTALRIRKFTPAVAGSFNLLPQDIGRPIEHIAYTIKGHNTMVEDIRRVINTGEMSEWEIQNNEGRWMLNRILPYQSSSKNIEGAIITFIDIDGVKKAEEELRVLNQDLEKAVQERAKQVVESERLNRLVIEATSVAVWDWDLMIDEMIWTGKMKETFGYPTGKMVNPKVWWSNKIGPDDWERVTESLDTHIQNGQGIWREEYYFYKADGSLAYVIDWGLVVRDQTGKALRMVGALLDVTELKHAQTALQRMLRRQQSLVRTIGQITYERDVKTGTINATGLDILGYEDDEPGTSIAEWEQLLHPDDLAVARKEMVSVRKGNPTFNIECRYRHKKGHYVWFHDRAIAYYDRKGDVEIVIGVLEDISKQRNYQHQLEAEKEKLKVSNQELEQFAYVASHDMKEPLRTITSYVSLLGQRYTDKLDDHGKEFMGFIVDGANRMSQMIDGLLDYSKVSSKEYVFKKVSLNKIIKTALKDLDSLLNESDVRIEVDKLPSLPVDENQIIRLFENLLRNAIRFNQSKPPVIKIWAEKDDNFWKIAVRDNGIGIEKEQLKNIFQLFRRLNSRQDYPGTGMGLAICERIVSRHGGKIWVESKVGKGATFYFTLPSKDIGGELAD